MTSAKKSVRSRDRSQSAPQGPSAESKSVSDGFLAAHRDYVKSMGEVLAQLQERCRRAQAEYRWALYEAQLNSQKAHEDAYRGYVAALHETYAHENARGLAREAEQRYAKDLEGSQARAHKSLEEANRVASSAVREANEEANKVWAKARLTYLKAVQEGFARVDPQALGADAMTLIGQSLIASARYVRPNPPA